MAEKLSRIFMKLPEVLLIRPEITETDPSLCAQYSGLDAHEEGGPSFGFLSNRGFA
jgi:hypothetical protein